MRLCALLVVLAGVLALPARGAVLFGNATGNVDIVSQVGQAFQLPASDVAHFSHDVSRPASGLFQQTLQDSLSSGQYGTVSAMASQVSFFDQSQGELTGASFAGTSAVTAATFAPYGSNTLARSEQLFTFQVAQEPEDYTLAIHFTPLGATAGSYVVLRSISGVPNALLAEAASNTAASGAVTLTGTLQPGWYSIYSCVQSGALAPATPTVAFADSMTYTFSITTTPEPATVALLALGGLLIRRRR